MRGATSDQQQRSRRWRTVKRHWQLYVLLLPPLAFLLVFSYWPMYGAIIAFQNFIPGSSILSAPWVGFKNFTDFLNSFDFSSTMRNTLVLSLYGLIVGFPLTLALAIGIHNVQRRWFKSTIQLVAFAPYFISTVVMAGIILQFLQPDTGWFAHVGALLGLPPSNPMADPALFPHIYVWSGLWQTLGFNSVIYIAALASVDPALHEAAIIDGASRLQRIWFIDLPEIMPLAILLTLLGLGNILSTGFEKVLLLQNPLNLSSSEVIDTYVYHVGIASMIPNFSYATAIGLFKSVIGLILVVTANRVAARFGGAAQVY